MKRAEALLAALGVLLLAVGTYYTTRLRGPMRDTVIEGSGPDTCRVPVRILEPLTGAAARGQAIVFHGLSANRRLMQPLGTSLAADGWRVYLVDLPGHGDNEEPYSFARAQQCARFLADELAQRAEIDFQKTVLVGHSMGAAVAVRLADRFPTAGTIALSPAPMVLPQRMPSNLYVSVSQLDLPRIKGSAAEIVSAAGGQRDQPEDFLERRAVKFQAFPYATHTSILWDARVARAVVAWAAEAVPSPQPARPFHSPASELLGAVAGLVGLLFLFPLTTTLFTEAFGADCATRDEPSQAKPLGAASALLRWAAASIFVAGVLAFWQPLRALRIVGGDYLASFLLLTGGLLLALLWPQVKATLRPQPRRCAVAGLLSLAAIVAFGAWLNWTLTDAWPIGARWLRLVVLVPVSLPYFAAEEVALGPPTRPHRARRFLLFLFLRLVPWLAMIFAFYFLASGDILILLLGIFLTLFSIFQRLGADAMRRRSNSATATALFDAILAAWFIAAVFPMR